MVLIMAILFFTMPLYGFTLDIAAEINYFGKGTVTVDIDSEENIEAVESKIEDSLYGYNIIASRNDIVELKSLKQTDSGFAATISFQRIDKVNGLGSVERGDCGELLEGGSETRELLNRWEKGNLKVTTAVQKFGVLENVIVQKKYNDTNDFKIQPTLADGTVISLTTMEETKSFEKDKLLIFQLYDLPSVSAITIKFPGKIDVTSSLNVQKLDEYTVKLTPTVIKADVMSADGEPRIGSDTSCFIGFIAYKSGTNPIVVSAVVVAVVLIVVVLVLMYVHYGYRKGGIAKLRAEPATVETKENDKETSNDENKR